MRKHIIALLIGISISIASCSAPSPSESPNSRYHTQSAAFNQLLDAAPIVEVNLDTVPIDTIWLEPDEMRCNIEIVDPQGNQSPFNIISFAPLDENLVAVTSRDGLGILNWAAAEVTPKFRTGNGPGEVDDYTILSRQGDRILSEVKASPI